MPKLSSIFLMAFAGAAAATAMVRLRKKEGAKSLQPSAGHRPDDVARRITVTTTPARQPGTQFHP